MKALVPMTLSQCKNPIALLHDPGDEFSVKITKTGKQVAKLHAGGIKRTRVQHKSGKTVDYVCS